MGHGLAGGGAISDGDIDGECASYGGRDMGGVPCKSRLGTSWLPKDSC